MTKWVAKGYSFVRFQRIFTFVAWMYIPERFAPRLGFALFGARLAVEEDRVKHHVTDWARTLEALRDGRLDLYRARGFEKLNDCLAEVIVEES